MAIYNLDTIQNNLKRQGQSDFSCGFTNHFKQWISSSKYKDQNFQRKQLKFCSSLGGKQSENQKIQKIPIIFIHGNTDVGYGKGIPDGKQSYQTGFRSLADYFNINGYKKSQLYTFTWGHANQLLASQTIHSKQNVLKVRSFIESVIQYTGSDKVNVIGHSMGVTLARKAIKGGKAVQYLGQHYQVGNSISKKIKTFVGIAGANYGITSCWSTSGLPTCNMNNGFFPGATALSSPSAYLHQLNNNKQVQGSHVYSIWSTFDDVLLLQTLVWGKSTCKIPGQDGQIQKKSAQWGHFALRDNTGPDIIKLM